MGSPVNTSGKDVKLPQHGGEGKEKYRKSSDMRLPQHGGEGKSMGKKSDMGLLEPTKKGYAADGRFLKVQADSASSVGRAGGKMSY